MPTISTRKRTLINDKKLIAALIITALAAALFSGGCGLQIEEANEAFSKALVRQQEAETILSRLKAFPQEWELLFSIQPVGPDQITQARQVIQARAKDVDDLEKTLEAWADELKPVLDLNVDQKVKDYVELRLESIECWNSYVTGYLRPIVASYGEIVELIAYDRPFAEQEAAAQELARLVKESGELLQQCEEQSKKADDYFDENKLGP